jgi:hypothetical protein
VTKGVGFPIPERAFDEQQVQELTGFLGSRGLLG